MKETMMLTERAKEVIDRAITWFRFAQWVFVSYALIDRFGWRDGIAIWCVANLAYAAYSEIHSGADR